MLAPLTWFRVGGNAKNFVRISSIESARELLHTLPDFFIIGNTSNLLISDAEIEQCVVKLGSAFSKIEQISETSFKVGASCLDSTFAQTMQEKGISGMEFLGTIPGTIGGNVAMNAGCFGSEIFEILDFIEIMLPNGEIINLNKNEISYEYRKTLLPEKSIIISAVVSGVVSNSESIKKTMQNFMQQRLESQPSNVRTGGSTFTNPKNSKKSAWQLIREVGADKFQVGGAIVSEKHANFLINAGGAKASDIFNLGEMIRKAVFEKTGVELEWEIKRFGKF